MFNCSNAMRADKSRQLWSCNLRQRHARFRVLRIPSDRLQAPPAQHLPARWFREQFRSSQAREQRKALWQSKPLPQQSFPPAARCIDREFPSENFVAGLAVRNFAPERRSVRYPRRRCRRPAKEYRPRDIALQPAGRGGLSNAPYLPSFEVGSTPVNSTQVLRRGGVWKCGKRLRERIF